jgi:hypothetical protein
MTRERATRPARNDPCPCGSGKKFKKCHLGREPPVTSSAQVDPAYRQRRLEAARIQRERQQGLGKPIISANVKGEYMSGSGKVESIPYSGGTAAFMHLAYDLYSLDHNAELQERLLTRLRHPQGFPGARYETYVAAVFIRAGFDLVFENEQDGSTTHCEFTATHRGTGKTFSVEAKRREGKRLRLSRLFNDALSKQANHTRVVFMDINTPDEGQGDVRPLFLTTVRNRLRAWEGTLLNGQPRPAAYVVMTNMPREYDLDGPAARSTTSRVG